MKYAIQKITASLAGICLLLPALAQAQRPVSEAEVHAYRQTMSAAGQALARGDAASAFPQVLAMAQKGFAEAQYIVATLYHDGEGTPANPEQARHWYRAAAQSGNRAVAQLAQEALAQLQ
ncbi:SEL1-like repeat protein [Conchiformibius kuhniae]|uniref:Sel1 repeat family protein n=1 Tax=Conchiformibius kuhniae TaxID=211502 RepID=A0A8T9MSN0_9NEIS|nr:hypothetical protein [Conchiformibius kuhniae]UOP04890.1 hypothetical protein LVJ77_00505 [Conchiformibius kuhniae]